MEEKFRLGIIGFGEVGFAMAVGLKERLGQIAIYDVLLNKDPENKLLKERIKKAQVNPYTKLELFIKDIDVIFSTNSAGVALSVAEDIADFIEKRHLFVDLNTTSPEVQERIQETLEDSGCKLVDGAIMGSIAANGYQTPIIASGNGRVLFRDLFKPYGMNINPDLVQKFGQASALKMYRSIFVKGIGALLIETLVAAYKYEVGDKVFDLICSWMDDCQEFATLTKEIVKNYAIHAERQAIEMDNVCQTVRQVDIEPIMSEATMERLKKTAATGIREHFSGKAPDDYMKIIEFLELHLH